MECNKLRTSWGRIEFLPLWMQALDVMLPKWVLWLHILRKTFMRSET